MKKSIQEHITLLSPTDIIIAPIQINYDNDEDAANPVEINLTYNGVIYQGKGTDHLWVDAFAALQNRLPKGIKLACCMTCRHGNMCPYGNVENQLFCTKGLEITGKDDIIELFSSTKPFDKRLVASFDSCEDFVYQNDEYYTYNDYLYELRKKESSKKQ